MQTEEVGAWQCLAPAFYVTLPVCATKRGGSCWHSPNLPQGAHRSLLAVSGVTMMQSSHPSADVPAYKQSPRKTRIDSGCCIHSWQHCLSLHLPLSLSSVQVELCAYWTCKCFWDPITKVLEKNSVGFCAKNQFTWQQPWPQHVLPLAGLVLGIITACTWECPACTKMEMYLGSATEIQCHSTALNLYSVNAFRVFVQFHKIKITCLLRSTWFKAAGSRETIPCILLFKKILLN